MIKLKNLLITVCFSAIMVIASARVAGAASIVYEEGKRVYDYAKLLSDYEEEKLKERALQVENAVKAEVYILTTNDTDGKSSMEYADDFGDNGAFGYECEYGTYIVMLINMDEREVWISTSGKAEEYFSEYRIEHTLDAVFEYLPDGNYYEACHAYINEVEQFMADGSPSVDDEYDFPAYDDNDDGYFYYDDDYYDDTYDDDDYYYDDVYRGKDKGVKDIIFPALVISSVVSGIVLAVLIGSNSTRMTAGSRTYMAQEGIRVHAKEDVFTHTTTVKRRIDTDGGGSRSGGGGSRHSGGGGHHRSSSGHSHGGGGRRF